jgi:hypothetical protein
MAKKTKAKAKAKTREAPKASAAKSAPTGPDLTRAFRLELQAAPPPVPTSNVVTLDADVAPHFGSSRAVNEALRALLRIVRQVRSTM